MMGSMPKQCAIKYKRLMNLYSFLGFKKTCYHGSVCGTSKRIHLNHVMELHFIYLKKIFPHHQPTQISMLYYIHMELYCEWLVRKIFTNRGLKPLRKLELWIPMHIYLTWLSDLNIGWSQKIRTLVRFRLRKSRL